jgi:hypothetical protein
LNVKRREKRRKKEKKEKIGPRRDSNLQPLDKKSTTLPLDQRGMDVNRSQKCVYIAILITKVKISTPGRCSIFRHNKQRQQDPIVGYF